jgi:tetratricopeptide (TPR) repeat protein
MSSHKDKPAIFREIYIASDRLDKRPFKEVDRSNIDWHHLEALCAEAEDLDSRGRYREAIRLYDKALRIDPENHQILLSKDIAEQRRDSAYDYEADRLLNLLHVPWLYTFFESKNGKAMRRAEREEEAADAARIRSEQHEKIQVEREQRREVEWAAYTQLSNEIRAMPRYQVWRQDVLARYGRICAICGSEENLEVDHFPKSLHALVVQYGIKSAGVEAYECTALWDVNNGAVLCKGCHDKTTSSKYRASKL